VISRAAAIRISSEHFPKGPEELAKRLGIEVFVSPLAGVDGWCVRGPHTVIRVNSNSSPSRQRFTLFENDFSFRQSVAASFGTVKKKCNGQNLGDAIKFFYENYVGTKYTGSEAEALRSPAGRKYARLYLERWFK